MKPASVNLYVGSPEDDVFGTYLYLELAIPGVGTFELETTNRLNDEDEEDVIEAVVKTLNKAALAKKALNIPVFIDTEEIQATCVELDLSEDAIREIKTFIREFFQETKGAK